MSTIAPFPTVAGTAAGTEAHLTDLGNVQRFYERWGRTLRYCPQLGGWFEWDGARWSADEDGRLVWVKAAETMRELYAAAGDTLDPKERSKIAAFAQQCESRRALEALVTLAGKLALDGGISVRAVEFDADPWSLNTPSGILNLRTGELAPHDRAKLHSKITGAPFVPDARSEVWDNFLRDVAPDEKLRGFLQRAAGSALVGQQRDERVYFVHGPGASGKSTFIRAIQAALGSYGTTVAFESLLDRRPNGGGPREDLARLVGCRFAAALEVDEGRRLAAGLVKTLVGGDRIAARFLYGRTFEYVPTFGLWLVANTRPRVSAEDAAMWRRITEIPFTTVISEAARSIDLKSRLSQGDESAAVLRWLVDGCKAWQKDGLDVPDVVRLATEDYRAEVDVIGAFLAECTELQPQLRAPAKVLHQTYVSFAKQSGEHTLLGIRAFKATLEARGFRQEGRASSGMRWRGIGILHDAGDLDPDAHGDGR